MEETIIISLGGSLIIPDNIDVNFLKEFKALILSHVAKGKKFVIITGGGKLCRRYQDAARELTNPSTLDLDWIGIASLKLNAELLRVVFGEFAHSEVISDLTTRLTFGKPIIIGSANKPGWSSDYDATLAAKSVGAKKVINLSNADYVYDSDPKINPNAKKLEKVSWPEYRAIIPKDWSSGMHTPFDPIASEMAQKEGITVMIMNGKPIDNLANCLDGEKFLGTIIS
jgi:uridylate kinase